MTVINRIQDDAAYRLTYPDMKGSGDQAGLQEVHIFLQDLNPQQSELERYYKAVDEWNDLHPNVTDKMKACFLALVFRDAEGQEKTISVMQSARYIRSNSSDAVVKEAHADADWFAKKGFVVIREKIEASAYGMRGIPLTDEEMQRYPTKYFEFHIKVGRKDAEKNDLLSEEELTELKKVSEEFTKKFQTPIPLSYNRNPHQQKGDGQGSQRFLNVRFRNIGLDQVKTHIKEIEAAIQASRSFKVLKTISEYVWYDSFTALDHGWIDYTPEELAKRLQRVALPKIVAFLGQKQVGKDTASDYLCHQHGYTKYGLADPMKQALQQLFKLKPAQLWGDEKEAVDPYWKVTPRELMQFIGIDTLYEQLSARFPQIDGSFAMKHLELYMAEHPDAKIAISDLRMQVDVDALKRMGALIIRLERPGLAPQDPHNSESGVPTIQGHDRLIVNDTTISSLEQKIEEELLCLRQL